MEKFYITTTLPYVNADPHIGFAAEIIKADVIARYKRTLGYEVVFNTGTDEHGVKIFRKAQEAGREVQEYCDYYASKFKDLGELLDLSYTDFIRTTDAGHILAAQEFWRRCDGAGDIYKKSYQVKYCVGCELEKTDSELSDGKCPLHPNAELELIDEENYFFRFSKYGQRLLELYENNPDFIIPRERGNEIKEFVKRGLQDSSISRLASKMPWGVPVPGDEEQVMYVWFDALVNYISTLGWPEEGSRFKDYWPGVQVAGKDNLRQQTAMWQAMLMSAGIESSKQVLIFGFITSNGQKMSKSIGNVVSSVELVGKYGTDAVRYYLLSEITPFEDGDYTEEKFIAKYNADPANGIGNLAARVAALSEKFEAKYEAGGDSYSLDETSDLIIEFRKKMEEYRFDEALKVIWQEIKKNDEYLSEKKPWKMESTEDVRECLAPVVNSLRVIARLISPFMPSTSKRLSETLAGPELIKGESLFQRIN